MCVVFINVINNVLHFPFSSLFVLCVGQDDCMITFIRSKLFNEDRHGGINVILNMITTKMISI